MSVGPIPWTAIQTWSESNGLSVGEKEELFFLINRMDSVYLKLIKDDSEKKRASTKKGR